MPEDSGVDETQRRSLLKRAALAGVPLFAGASGVASASTSHNHLGDFWSGDGQLTIYKKSGKTPMRISGQNSGPSFMVDSSTDEAIRASASNSNPAIESRGDLRVEGDLAVTGTKNFAQTVETPDGPQELTYTAVEADQAQTETTGVTEMSGGRTEIELPDHFGHVTSDEEELVVQLTPYELDGPRLAVTERSTDRIVVEADDDTTTEFSYTVRGVRAGYEDEHPAGDSESTTEDSA